MSILSFTYLTGLLFVALSCSYTRDSEPVADKGVLDLRDYSFKNEGPLELKGEFEFHWNQMLDPSMDGDSDPASYIRVPGSWTRERRSNPEIRRFGFATYRLMILLPEGVDELSFSVSTVYSASGFFLNGKAVDFLGYPDVNKYQTVIKYNRPVMTGSVNSSRAELLIRVSNFDHQFSGIVGSIEMGLPEQIAEKRQKQLFQGYFLIGAFLIICIYFLGLFLIRSERYRLYFALICFLMAIRVVMVMQMPLLSHFQPGGLMLARIDYLNIYLFAPFFTLMIRSIFPYEFPRKGFNIVMWVSTVFILLVVVTPISLFSFTLIWFFVFFLGVSMLYLYVVILAWKRGRSHAPSFAIGLIILFLGTLNDMLMEVDVIESSYMIHYAMFAYLLIYAYIFADKSNQLQQKAEKLTQDLNQVRNNLEDLVEERTTELQLVSRQLEQQKRKLEVSNRDLMEAMNARNRLFSIIGHDIRAPIGYTRQALEMMLENKDMDEAERNELIRMMASSSETTYNLLDNLLVWGRSQTGKLKSNPDRFQLNALIEESVDLVNIGIREKMLKVEVFISEEHYLEADRDQLYVVIRNLLSNAMKFTPEKGSIYISSKKQKGQVVLSIRDTGIGIPESMQEKMLDTRTHFSTNGTHGEKGSGLGLKICQEIIQSNNGWMKIESKPGSGTTILMGIKSARTLR